MVSIKRSTFEFLEDIKRNNDRIWFADNRQRYDEARENFREFVQELIDNITQFEPILKGLEAKSCIFRINRDIRFTKDKTIYKTHFGAFIVRGGRKNGDRFAGYYLHLEPGASFIAGGAYIPPREWLAAIRQRIDNEGDMLEEIIGSSEFAGYFGGLGGERLTRPPRGYTKDNPHIELIKMKSFLAEISFSDREVLDSGFLKRITAVYRAIRPLNDFLNMKS